MKLAKPLGWHGLEVGYPPCALASFPDLTLAPGRVYALLGRNGAGKSTFLRTLCGLIPPVAGEVRVEAASLAALPESARAQHLAYIPQSADRPADYRVRDVVALGGWRHGSLLQPAPQAEERCTEVLDRIGIVHLADRAVTQISGGEWQRVQWARALMQDAEWLVMDEPTAHLDFPAQQELAGHIQAWRPEGRGVVLATHDPDWAGMLDAEIWLMAERKVVTFAHMADAANSPELEKCLGVRLEPLVDAQGRTRWVPARTG
ncbi:MAG: ABC transporter ATP-binding protein [Armatimonadota bacterium]